MQRGIHFGWSSYNTPTVISYKIVHMLIFFSYATLYVLSWGKLDRRFARGGMFNSFQLKKIGSCKSTSNPRPNLNLKPQYFSYLLQSTPPTGNLNSESKKWLTILYDAIELLFLFFLEKIYFSLFISFRVIDNILCK